MVASMLKILDQMLNVLVTWKKKGIESYDSGIMMFCKKENLF